MKANLKIDSHTDVYGVFGNPIRHSMSPIMLNRAFAEMAIPAVYTAFEVKAEQLQDAIQGVKALNIKGINVTIPHKVEIMRYLDELDDHALRIGAVNTVVHHDGKLIGYNTDGIGYTRSLKEETGCTLQGKRVLIIGAGGASRGIAYALAQEGLDRMYVANRSLDKATQLAESLRGYTDTRSLGIEQVQAVLPEVDVIVNTTSVGMYPHTQEVPIPTEGINAQHLVSDVIYNPSETRLLQEAKLRGAQIHGGLGMFIYQGAYAFEYWTHQLAPVAAMREVVEQSLQRVLYSKR
jgi:shikimate dehydrogenase